MNLNDLYTPAALLTAGGFVYMVRRMRRDLNGIGKRVADGAKRENVRHNNVNLAILCMVPDDKKKEIAALLHEEV